jgi:hypothetical protein
MGRSEMSGSDGGEQKKEEKDNIVRLGTEALFAIADELRRMYDADLRLRPSEPLERLIQKIKNDEDLSRKPESPA